MIRPQDINTLDDASRLAQELIRMETRIEGGWELFQILTHIAESIENSMTGFPSYHPLLIRRTLGAWLFSRLEKSGYRTKRDPHPPLASLDGDSQEALQRYREASARFYEFEGEVAEHPFFGRLSYEEWHRYHLWHSVHHLNAVIPLESRPHMIQPVDEIPAIHSRKPRKKNVRSSATTVPVQKDQAVSKKKASTKSRKTASTSEKKRPLSAKKSPASATKKAIRNSGKVAKKKRSSPVSSKKKV